MSNCTPDRRLRPRHDAAARASRPARERRGGRAGCARTCSRAGSTSILTLAVDLRRLLARCRTSLPWFAACGLERRARCSECRAIIADQLWGEGATGACFAVIRERWKQFLFGFYPSELYWRPTLAFILMFVALAPILFSELPRKMLWLSLAVPGRRLLAALGRLDLRADRDRRRLRASARSSTARSPARASDLLRADRRRRRRGAGLVALSRRPARRRLLAGVRHRR